MSSVVQDFVKQFTENYDKVMDLDQSFTDTGSDFHEWELGVLTRSANLRLIFANNEDILDFLKDFVSKPLNDESALELYRAVESLYLGCYDDLLVTRILCAPLLKYYGDKKDYEKVIFLSAVTGYEIYDFFGRIIGSDKYIQESIECYKKIVENAWYYDQIKEQSSRVRILTAFGNLISPLGRYNPDAENDIFKYYDKAYRLYNDCAKAIDGEDLDGIMHLMDASILEYENRINDFSGEHVKRFTEIVEKLESEQTFTDDGGELYRARTAIEVFNDRKSAKEAIEELIAYINGIQEPDYDSISDAYLEGYINNPSNCGIDILGYFDQFSVPKEIQREYMKQFVKSVTKKLVQIPHKVMTTTVSEACSTWFTHAVRRIDDYGEKRQLLMDMILCRQPYTYIHSRMVQKLSHAIACRMVEKGSHFFDTVELEEGDNLLDYIKESAFLHDIGKCAIEEVINKQYRKLADFEFDIIKRHPVMAFEISDNDPSLMKYADVIMGHHKTYDGKGGYPADFDNRASKVAPVIDLIAICDAMDAATDVYGRNYHPGKNFDTLFDELEKGKGSRYFPEIVDFIGNDQELYDALKELTDNRRGEIYYSVYQELEKIKSKI